MEVLKYDVVCIGAGGAGVTAAFVAAAAGAKALIISKEPIGYGNTRIAGGAVSSCGIVSEDNSEAFLLDLMAGGEHLNNPKLARVVAEEARLGIAIAESQGQLFRRDADGQISRKVTTRAGGHTHHRTVETPGRGVAIGQALRAAAAQANVDLVEEAMTAKLLLNRGRVAGLVGWNLRTGEPLVVETPSVILATGGFGWMYYPHTDCMRSSTGDGYALAYEAGTELVDMEQVQFLPFGCTRPASMVGLGIGEPAWAGPLGKLLDGRGREVLSGGINRMTRAQVARVIALEVQQGNGTADGGLLLDLSPNLSHPMGKVAWEKMKGTGLLDIARRAYGPKAYTWEQPWEVAPTAHFTMGGVRTDEHGATAVDGLYAAGEIAGGVHGANRLGSVALAELFVIGRRAGRAAATYARSIDRPNLPADEAAEAVFAIERLPGGSGANRPVTLVRRLQRLMWAGAGPARCEEWTKAALTDLDDIQRQAASLRVSKVTALNGELQDALELRMMLPIAAAVLRSVAARQESRGAHVRIDYPERDDGHWLANIVCRRQDEGMKLAVERIAQP